MRGLGKGTRTSQCSLNSLSGTGSRGDSTEVARKDGVVSKSNVSEDLENNELIGVGACSSLSTTILQQ
jgi:hypothetical protein